MSGVHSGMLFWWNGDKLTAGVRNGAEWFIWRMTEAQLPDVLRSIGEHAGRGAISWYQAAVLTREIRHELAIAQVYED